MAYTDEFYDTIRAGAQSSASVIVPLLMDHLVPTTVLDVGCGEGWFSRAFADTGLVKVTAIDGHYVGQRAVETFIEHDLTQPFPDEAPVVDVVLCLEVAEHLPAARAASFVAELCDHAENAVVFSAAIPGQGGAGHINEQWPAYWDGLFASHGFGTEDLLRWQLWGSALVEPWYQQNILIYERATDAPVPPAVVHPTIYDARRGA